MKQIIIDTVKESKGRGDILAVTWFYYFCPGFEQTGLC